MKRNYVVIKTNDKGERISREWIRSNEPLTIKEKAIVNMMGISGMSTLISGGMLMNAVLVR